MIIFCRLHLFLICGLLFGCKATPNNQARFEQVVDPVASPTVTPSPAPTPTPTPTPVPTPVPTPTPTASPTATPSPSPSPTPRARLEVPIEMIDKGLEGSNGSTINYSSSQTSFDTTDYDGVGAYRFEIVATNTQGVSVDVSIIDSTAAIKGTISIPTGTTVPTRFLTTFTPNGGADVYRVQTGSPGYNMSVYAARIKVEQINATKTKIYYPLLASGPSGVTPGVDAPSFSWVGQTSSASSYTQGGFTSAYSLWKKDVSAYADLAPINPWTFEVILGGSSPGSVSYASLFGLSSGQVSDSEVSTTLGTSTLLSSSFSDSATNFSDLEKFQVQMKTSSSMNTAYLSKAGLWLKLVNLTQGEVYFRFGKSLSNVGTSTTYDTQRIWIDPTHFTNPQFYHESTGNKAFSGESDIASILDVGATDSGTSGSVISGSGLDFASATQVWYRTSSFSIPSVTQLIERVEVAGQINLTNDFLVVKFHN